MPDTKPYVIPKQLVWDAYQRVKANQGAAGVADRQFSHDQSAKIRTRLVECAPRLHIGRVACNLFERRKAHGSATDAVRLALPHTAKRH